MKTLIYKLILFSWLLFSFPDTAPNRNIASTNQISKNTFQLVTWETTANAISLRSNKAQKIEHYEIPLNLLQQSIDQLTDASLKDSLIFQKDGEPYVRWIINPEDHSWHFQVKKFLAHHGLDTDPKTFFTGYLTASRSLILMNPLSGTTFF